ncbi:hypothetical protein ADUPG1_010895, partial [Aduncisulcus paluster]
MPSESNPSSSESSKRRSSKPASSDNPFELTCQKLDKRIKKSYKELKTRFQGKLFDEDSCLMDSSAIQKYLKSIVEQTPSMELLSSVLFQIDAKIDSMDECPVEKKKMAKLHRSLMDTIVVFNCFSAFVYDINNMYKTHAETIKERYPLFLGKLEKMFRKKEFSSLITYITEFLDVLIHAPRMSYYGFPLTPELKNSLLLRPSNHLSIRRSEPHDVLNMKYNEVEEIWDSFDGRLFGRYYDEGEDEIEVLRKLVRDTFDWPITSTISMPLFSIRAHETNRVFVIFRKLTNIVDSKRIPLEDLLSAKRVYPKIERTAKQFKSRRRSTASSPAAPAVNLGYACSTPDMSSIACSVAFKRFYSKLKKCPMKMMIGFDRDAVDECSRMDSSKSSQYPHIIPPYTLCIDKLSGCNVIDDAWSDLNEFLYKNRTLLSLDMCTGQVENICGKERKNIQMTRVEAIVKYVVDEEASKEKEREERFQELKEKYEKMIRDAKHQSKEIRRDLESKRKEITEMEEEKQQVEDDCAEKEGEICTLSKEINKLEIGMISKNRNLKRILSTLDDACGRLTESTMSYSEQLIRIEQQDNDLCQTESEVKKQNAQLTKQLDAIGKKRQKAIEEKKKHDKQSQKLEKKYEEDMKRLDDEKKAIDTRE